MNKFGIPINLTKISTKEYACFSKVTGNLRKFEKKNVIENCSDKHHLQLVSFHYTLNNK